MADIAHMDLMAAITQNLRYKQDGGSSFHVCSWYLAADERVGHPHPDWDPAGRGAQGSGQKCQEGALHAG